MVSVRNLREANYINLTNQNTNFKNSDDADRGSYKGSLIDKISQISSKNKEKKNVRRRHHDVAIKSGERVIENPMKLQDLIPKGSYEKKSKKEKSNRKKSAI